MLRRIVRRPVQEIAPWATMVTPELVLDKDGSLLTCFTFEGVDADSPNADDISSMRTNLDNACKNFDHRITAWWRLSHRRVRGAIDGAFTADIDAYVDRINRNHVSSGKFFRNTHSLSLAYTPETGINKVFDKVAYHMTVGGKSMLPALVETAKDTFFARSAFVFDLERMTSDIKRFESILDAFKGGVTRLKAKRLELQNALAYLHQTANPSVPPRRVRYPVTMLDTHLTESTVLYPEVCAGRYRAASRKGAPALLHGEGTDGLGTASCHRNHSPGPATPPDVVLIIDEVAEAINEQVIQILNKGRGAGFKALVAFQTRADLEAKLGNAAKMLQVLGNLDNQINRNLSACYTAIPARSRYSRMHFRCDAALYQ